MTTTTNDAGRSDALDRSETGSIGIALYPVDDTDGTVRIWGIVPQEACMTGLRIGFQLNKTVRRGANFMRIRRHDHGAPKHREATRYANISARSREFDFKLSVSHPLVKHLRAATGKDEFGVTEFPVKLYPDQPSAEVACPLPGTVKPVSRGRNPVTPVQPKRQRQAQDTRQSELPL